MVLVLPGLGRVPGIALEVITRGAIGRYWAGEEGMVADMQGIILVRGLRLGQIYGQRHMRSSPGLRSMCTAAEVGRVG